MKKPRPQADELRQVYFIEAVGSGCLKIGIAANPSARLKDLQVGCPLPLVLMASAGATDARGLEQSYHSRFEDDWVRGEWFRLTERTRAVVTEYVELQALAEKHGCSVGILNTYPEPPLLRVARKPGESVDAFAERAHSEFTAAGFDLAA